MEYCNQNRGETLNLRQVDHHRKRTLWVVIITFAMMIIEIIAGTLTGSMSLLADGWHMASHAAALTLNYLVYWLIQSNRLSPKLSFGTGKLLPLGGYTSGIGLGLVAIWMAGESIARIFHPGQIEFIEAIGVATVGLVVNLLSAWILVSGKSEDDHPDWIAHHHEETRDHNHESAVLHVIADAMTSVAAIAALMIGKYFLITWIDPLVGILGAIIVFRWAYQLCRASAWELLDGQPERLDLEDLRSKIENKTDSKIIDLHVWNLSPGNLACQVILESTIPRGAEYYRKSILSLLSVKHLVVEERTLAQT